MRRHRGAPGHALGFGVAFNVRAATPPDGGAFSRDD
jgi:hypothetical protein